MSAPRPPHAPALGDEGPDGYRRRPAGGAWLRADVVEVWVARRVGADGAIEVLQVRRATMPLAGTWQPVMGHVEAGESCVRAALRELREEVGLAAGPELLDLWALEQVHPYFIAALDCIVLSPRFVALARAGWEPRLNHEHSAHRWLALPAPGASTGPGHLDVMWPGQRAALEELMLVLAPGSPARAALRVDVSALS